MKNFFYFGNIIFIIFGITTIYISSIKELSISITIFAVIFIFLGCFNLYKKRFMSKIEKIFVILFILLLLSLVLSIFLKYYK